MSASSPSSSSASAAAPSNPRPAAPNPNAGAAAAAAAAAVPIPAANNPAVEGAAAAAVNNNNNNTPPTPPFRIRPSNGHVVASSGRSIPLITIKADGGVIKKPPGSKPLKCELEQMEHAFLDIDEEDPSQDEWTFKSRDHSEKVSRSRTSKT